ncbi:19 kDa lipoprotein antigen LpqH-like protein OS=Tsukamurella paurometabola (strain ATCC 8368 / DSM / CCUG 35730 / CIP 100753 / JCM 10117 / KCTC 9821 / NBRC 16120 / NCIMB 702349 / NCTC 13040) OX=521096 GN=Tpau_2742 PE=4 SV=1 [Tsukamurella paurometabola]|uniref:19 kDa lipoprotein antigen LpqH-like protein n=1 Tax=Tsukamurella paurometabola (strain ATCC 8368 / DSM 20162 / CCUG 35730 / CIP 100753 / JCM 10117 / KCTC 9821 / NBRC 16120 / NCIMB 702349 / NCTC 13040) TaxID=521096 RepID=D5USR9_TSUPD|nr:lipoprotein LpqH [Tsukamurella paurometabola]ADG79340.1 19 kDa lipoprotein antigen precursor LpqH-like protein [Tsukamurella paurometabola DSM 20162]SUP35157.1 Mycobacterium 19 kDa lipoprotein antigen [Tsukamurella paurometabola]
MRIRPLTARVAACTVLAGALVGASACTSPNIDSSTVVEVDGKRQDAAEYVNAGCSRTGDSITIGSGSVQTARGVGAMITDGNPPRVNTLFIATGSNVMTVTSTPVGQIGSATASRAGNRYTITGEARAADLSTKKFRVEVTCS